MSSDLEGAEEQVIEEANEPQERFSVHRLIDDEGEEDGMNPQQWNQCKCGFSQSEKENTNIIIILLYYSLMHDIFHQTTQDVVKSLPELIVCVPHLMSLKFGHQDLYNSNKYKEINLRKERERGENRRRRKKGCL